MQQIPGEASLWFQHYQNKTQVNYKLKLQKQQWEKDRHDWLIRKYHTQEIESVNYPQNQENYNYLEY